MWKSFLGPAPPPSLGRLGPHSGRQSGLAEHLLHSLQPDVFPKDAGANVWYAEITLDLLCVGSLYLT